jgi:ribosomal protein S18 acetylase RimI-like enzyme
VVREDFQGQGIATYMLDMLEKIAKENGYRAFSATVLRENLAMINVFKRRYPNARTVANGGSDITLIMEFEDAVPPPRGDKNASTCT